MILQGVSGENAQGSRMIHWVRAHGKLRPSNLGILHIFLQTKVTTKCYEK